ncbi:MAG: methyltransferase family protein [Candidatus Binatia bacterium]
MSPAIRTTLYAIIVLGLLLGYLPWQILQLDAALSAYLETTLTYSGALLFLVGALLLFTAAYYLVRRGDGTPLPLDPPKRMVVAGPYASIQHPMLLGLLMMAFGEALWFHSVILAVYAVLLAFVGNLFVIHIEEPSLEERFGDDYVAYQAATPRWLPLGRRRKEVLNTESSTSKLTTDH